MRLRVAPARHTVRHEPGFKPGFKRRGVHGADHRPLFSVLLRDLPRLEHLRDLGIRPRPPDPPILAPHPPVGSIGALAIAPSPRSVPLPPAFVFITAGVQEA